ncbi:MAG: hypothetical protein HZA93_23700 [Verrucomicrobia bacterium]|nr:hypothetical protein [Verrucomicrobiota bacterium]
MLATEIAGRFGQEPSKLAVFRNPAGGTVSLMLMHSAIVLDAKGHHELMQALAFPPLFEVTPEGTRVVGAAGCTVCGENPPVATVRERAGVRCRSKNILFRTALAIARRSKKGRR